MSEDDPLRGVLREWQAPEPAAEVDVRIRDAWRAGHRPMWRRVWTARVSVPVPVLAAATLLVAALLIEFRAIPAPAPAATAPKARLFATEMTESGFVALPNGAARVVAAKDVQQ